MEQHTTNWNWREYADEYTPEQWAKAARFAGFKSVKAYRRWMDRMHAQQAAA